MSAVHDTDMETLDEFRARARAFIQENISLAPPPQWPRGQMSDEEELVEVQQSREVQRRLFDGGLAGIVVPKEYGGQGLSLDHARVLNEEMAGREYPSRLQVPTMSPCMAVLLEFGTEEQKRDHVPAILRGDEIWMQMLSEPSGGSDVAGAQTSAVRDGDEWVLNGSKVWTTGAWWADWALCLARTDPDVPKHRGLSVFMVPFEIPGIEMHRIEMLNGSKEFCQEFLTDVRIPDSYRIGEVDAGWTVGTRWMFHERMFMNSPYVLAPVGALGAQGGTWERGLLDVTRQAGRADDPAARQLLGEAYALLLATGELSRRLPKAMRAGLMTDQGASVGKLMGCLLSRRMGQISWEITGGSAAVWDEDTDSDLGDRGVAFLGRQTGEIGGGTTEMARNVVSERVLGMPRERTVERDIAFRDIPKGPPAHSR